MKIKDMAGVAALALALLAAVPAGAQNEAAPGQVSPKLIAFEKGLHKQTGDVVIPGAKAVLHLGDRYYFLGPEESRQVLVDVWGNPSTEADNVRGMVFPAGVTTYDNIWGAVITYKEDGYVSDKDAKSADYDKVLEESRGDEDAQNAERKKSGYPEIHLVGWAQPPSYDPASHSLIWARDLRFSTGKVDTLNYDVRTLGRRGVLSLNMVSDMNHLADVRQAAATFGKAVAFQPGAAYADFDSKVDKTAEYGLAGLVAAGVGVVAVKKLGLLALVLGFGKKLILLLAVGAAAVARFFKKIFRRGEDPDVI